ncbi:MAG: WecB/TagA/CpsF family glycosyltransferase [Lachnospiraceae bacterium]|nr:WecB/TagA/CpsF family glycosyltransferase [Lachnospiraceae bacterium]
MKKINLLGISLQDRYVKESLNVAEKFLQEGAVHTILYITIPVLLEAGKNEACKEWVESADLTLWGDTEILKAAEITARNRYREVTEKEFLKNFLHKMARTHKSVLVLSDSEEHAEELKHELLELQDSITVVGTMAIPELEEKREDVINEINMIAPVVTIARMPFSMQQKWIEQTKPYMNTGIWIGLPEHMNCVWKKEAPHAKVIKRIWNVLFNRQVNKYKK